MPQILDLLLNCDDNKKSFAIANIESKKMSRRRAKIKKYVRTPADIIFTNSHWCLTTFAVVLVFLVFVMRAYTIPTGSMADTLRGEHFRLRCAQCGYQYNCGFVEEFYWLAGKTLPRNQPSRKPDHPRCSSCGFYLDTAQKMPVIKGDQIFVFKPIYSFTDPKRWDVAVFKSPVQPEINYIKRMIALPGETVQIIDGDIYIDGKIAAKPPKVQDELWMPVYDNDFQPVNPNVPGFNGHTWRQPFENLADAKWKVNSDDPTEFTLEDSGELLNTMVYNTNVGNDFRGSYAYNPPRFYRQMEVCSDLMIRFQVRSDGGGLVGGSLSKYGIEYRGMVDMAGRMYIEKIEPDGNVTELTSDSLELADVAVPASFSFANVDHQLVLTFADNKVRYDLGSSVGDAGDIRTDISPEIGFFGKGKLTLSHLAIFKDIHYGSNTQGRTYILQASQKNPLVLGKDEFFVCGDNSPASADGRRWKKPGTGNNGKTYTQGTVPRDYLVGKAFILHWPGPQKAFDKFSIIPYPGNIKFIAGGSEERL